VLNSTAVHFVQCCVLSNCCVWLLPTAVVVVVADYGVMGESKRCKEETNESTRSRERKKTERMSRLQRTSDGVFSEQFPNDVDKHECRMTRMTRIGFQRSEQNT
jgi:hypothetical protein